MALNMFDLTGRVAVVTGGYGVLGSSMAEGLADAGAFVALVGRDEEKGEEQADILRRRGASVMVLPANVLDQEELTDARDRLLREKGRIDILVNAAGGNVARARTDTRSVFSLHFDAYDEVVRLNLQGTVFPTLVFGEAMAEKKTGSIVNISSMAATHAISGVLGYSNAKAAVDNFTKWMATDLAQRHGEGLRVNAIAPGFFIATQNRDVLLNPDGSYTERAKTILKRTPMGRFGNPDELKGPVLWLCSDASAFVTGTVIPVDGGFSAYIGL